MTAFSVWPSGRTLLMEERLKRECHIADFCAPDDSNPNTSAIREWMRQAQAAGVAAVLGNDGNQAQADYLVEGELEVTRPGQVIRWAETGGFGYGESANPRLNWPRGTRLVAVGNFEKRVRTRRKHRATALSPEDSPISCVLNIQAEGVQIVNPCIWLRCDYSDMSPQNLGDDCGVGIFVGTRVGVKIYNPIVIGYFRNASIMYDASGAANLPRHLSVAGVPYPDGTVRNGSDGWRVDNPYLMGGRVGLAVLGARPQAGQTGYAAPYFDTLPVPDQRGLCGASDGLVTGGWIHSAEHHSNRRVADPVLSSGALNSASLHAESDTQPAAVYIDGLAGNASTNIWGIRFVGTRIATSEMFRVRLRKASRVAFFGCHIEGRNSDLETDSLGNPINTNDYALCTYGDISGETISDRILAIGSNRQAKADIFPHFYGAKPTFLTESGRLTVGGYVQSFGSELDIRGDTIRFRNLAGQTHQVIP